MPGFYFSACQRKGNTIIISGEEFHHMKHVRRIRQGDTVNGFDDEGCSYKLKISQIKDRELVAEIIEEYSTQAESSLQITLYQAVPKKQGMDSVIRKGTELGIHRFVPLQTSRTVARVTDENKAGKIRRWQRIAREAAKQCARSRIPDVLDVTDIKQLEMGDHGSECCFVLHGNARMSFRSFIAQLTEPREVLFMVGPEGGFDPDEIKCLEKKGFTAVNLGSRVMRTETAALVVTAIMQYLYGDF